ncbi:hypothetical protein PYS58_16460 [Chryseobacterium indologenes]|uniref:hypothetical protein n=1 Tax=Chryseobacterium indologenes TaxID=253 RepID=UPI0023E8E95C|nr:hypothetical protein [Chryseobacterium indologenes]WET48157.1 hypothetical protein PYS58_16460 [Chryseobacterium indologenes]
MEKQKLKREKRAKSFKFEVISDNQLTVAAYTQTCSGKVSDCCTRVCTRQAQPANVEQWGKFLAINAGVIQY